MKKIVLFITAIFIFVLLGAGGNVEDSAVHKLVSGDWIVSQSGTDTSLFRGSVDSLNMQISDSTQFALDSTRVMIKDSVNYVQTLLDDSIKASDHREILRSDSINTALRLAMIDSSKAIWTDSISQATVVIPNDIKIKGNDLTFGNGASITNPTSGILSLNSGIVSIPSDSTYAGQVLHADTTKTNVIILPNNAVISNVHADTLKLIEANTIIDGNAKINGLLSLTEGGYFESIGADTTAVVDAVFKSANDLYVQGDATIAGRLIESDPMVVIRNGDSLLIRTSYDTTRDLVQLVDNCFNKATTGSNEQFVILNTSLIPNTTAHTLSATLAARTVVHSMGDDTPPFSINGVNIYGGHGAPTRLVTSTGHGLTSTSIGIEWTDWTARKWYIVRIVNENTLWITSEDLIAGDVWSFDNDIDGNLWNGADSLYVITEATGSYQPILKNQFKYSYIDEERILSDGVYYGASLRFREIYDGVNPSAQLDSIIANAGTEISPNIGKAQITIHNEYEWDKYGSCVLKSKTYNPNYEANMTWFPYTQSAPAIINVGASAVYDSLYLYIPNTLTINDGTKDWNLSRLTGFNAPPSPNALTFTSTYWADVTNPPYRNIQYIGDNQSSIDVSYAHGYYINLADAKAKYRVSNTTNAWQITTTGKSYPAVYNSGYGSLSKTKMTEAICFRSYKKPTNYSNNASSVHFYTLGEEHIVMADYHTTVAFDSITVPDYMNGKLITITDKHTNTTVHSVIVNNNTIIISNAGDTGYAVLSLSDESNTVNNETTFENQVTFESEAVFKDIIKGNNSGVITLDDTLAKFDCDSNVFTYEVNFNDTVWVNGSKLKTAPIKTNLRLGIDGGKNLSTGYHNTILGNEAGVSTSSAYGNTFLGYSAGRICNGVNNVFIGTQAGRIAVGSNNTGVGTQALYSLTTSGVNNTVLGYQSGSALTSGSSNVFLGYKSVGNNTTGSYGVAIGDSSGYNNTTGSRNVFIGHKAIGTDTSSDQFILQSDNGSKVQRLGWGSFADSSFVHTGYTQILDSARIGFTGSNYTTIEKDGTIALHGTATAYLDEMSNLLSNQKVIGAAEIVNADTSGTVIFTADADTLDFVYMNIQLNHDRKLGSVIYPHLHWHQTQADSIGWQIAYRWQTNGQVKDGTWKWLKPQEVTEFTYTSGVLNQITEWAGISAPASDALSGILQIRLARRDDVAIEVHALSLDIHKEVDSIGSRMEYSK
jgi:hypothetical protein